MAQFSVSRTTVRQALADLSNEGLVERRRGSGTYRILPGVRRKGAQRSMLVGVWFNQPEGPLYGPMADGIREELLLWDYHAVFEGGLETGAQRRGIDSLVRKGLDGFIVSPSSDPRDPHDPIVEVLRQRLPLVLVDKRLPNCPADLVCTNGRLGAETLVEYLIHLGHRRIGFIGTAGVSTVEDRLDSCRLTLRKHGLTAEPGWIEVDPQVYMDYGREAARRILSRCPSARPTALFGANDPIAETIAGVAKELGLEVPRDLSVVGFDDAGFRTDATPWLTTYGQPKYLIGRQAAQALIRRMQEPDLPAQTILLQGEFIERRSAGPPPMDPDRPS